MRTRHNLRVLKRRSIVKSELLEWISIITCLQNFQQKDSEDGAATSNLEATIHRQFKASNEYHTSPQETTLSFGLVCLTAGDDMTNIF